MVLVGEFRLILLFLWLRPLLIIFCGDFRQADLQKNGLRDFIRILKATEQFDIFDFEIDDIVRSKFVKDYIIAKEQLGL